MLEGAESILKPIKFAGLDALKKIRVEKKYRPIELDQKLRFERTRLEARLLHKAKQASVLCPYVYAVGKDFIIMQKINNAKTLNMIEDINPRIIEECAKILSNMHSKDIIHGDFTTANIMLDEQQKLYVIDFGLGYIGQKDEDKAVDLLTMVNCLDDKDRKIFMCAYEKESTQNLKIALRMKKIESRARYKKREQT